MGDDVISFQKIPATQTKLNAHLFSAPSHDQEEVILKDVQNSITPQSSTNQPRGKKTGAKSFQGEAIKQKNYSSNLPSKDEYAQNKPTPVRTPGSMKSASPYSKTYSHAVNKENIGYEEQNNFITSNFEHPPESSAYTELANKLYIEKFGSNSQARKTNVAKTADPNLLLSTDEARKIEEKRYLGSRELQENVVNRLTNNANQSMDNSRIRENSYIDRNLEECTFTPSILSNKPQRELHQFLEDQKQFQDQSQAKIRRKQEEAIMEQSKMEPTYKPEICAKSVKILEKKQKDRTPVYQRLYNVGKNAQAKHMQGIAEKEDFFSNRDSLESSQFIGQINTRGDVATPTSDYRSTENLSFIPTIHKKSKKIVREDRVDNLLYYDALRRQHKVVENSKNTKKSSSVAPLSAASKRAVATRFIKEFDIGILEFLEIDKEPKLNYLQLNEFLKKLCFLKESEYIENPHFTPERLLLYDMWYMLRADQYRGIHRRNLLMFLLAVLDLYFPITKIQKFDDTTSREENFEGKPENPELAELLCDENGNPVLPEEEGFTRERRQIGDIDDDGNLELTEDEVKKVHKVFELWYINRMCAADNIGQLIKLRNYEEPTHQPRINESSKRLAQNYREKMLGGTAELIHQNKIPAPKDGKLTHADLLIISKKISTEKVNRFGELLEEEKNRGCTFKPHITQYGSTSSMTSSVRSRQESRGAGTPVSQASKNRVFELYSLAKPRVLKQDKNKEEFDFEKNYQECTFQPNVNLKREKPQRREATELYVKGVDKTIERMRNARAEKEQKMQQLQRGFSNGKEGHFVFTNDKKKFSNLGSPFDQYALMRRNYPEESYQGEYQDDEEEEMYDYENRHHAASHELYNQAQVMRGDDNQETNPYVTTGYEQQQTLDSRNYASHDGHHHHDKFSSRNPEIAELQKDEEEYDHEENENHEEEEEGQSEGEAEEHEQEQEQDDERVPLLFVDVNLGQGRTERIVVYEGDSPEELAQKFSEEHNLDISMKGRLIELLDSQIAGLLSRIDEEVTSAHSETERQKYGENFGHFDQIQEEDDYND